MSQRLEIFCYDEDVAAFPELAQGLLERGWTLQHLNLADLAELCAHKAAALVLFKCAQAPDDKILDLVGHLQTHEDSLPIFILAPEVPAECVATFMKAGVQDFLSLPVSLERLHEQLEHASRMHQLTRRVFQREHNFNEAGHFWGMVGQSPSIQENFKLITTVAKSQSTVLIQGESGTGKELVAKAIHALSGRSRGRFVDINCGAIPHDLLENELFGHERGAYTSADRRYIGSFERADGGTIFLDEIGEMDQSLQVKILRVLQEKSFMRVGGSELVQTDVRVLAATNRDPFTEVKAGRFREDLYYRLNVVPIILAPLRERREDIPLLARHFLQIYSQRNQKIFLDFHPQAIEALMNYNWPGNVRELENTIERVVVLSNDSQVKLKHLPAHLQSSGHGGAWEALHSSRKSGFGWPILSLEELEKNTIELALKTCHGSVAQAARQLKIGQATLYRKIRKLGLVREGSRES